MTTTTPVATTPRIVFEALAPDVVPPVRSTAGSAGYDVRAFLGAGVVKIHRRAGVGIVEEAPATDGGATFIELMPGERALVPTGFRARLPRGFEAQIRMRSSLAWKRGLIVPNAPGTVDADYPDEWFVLVLNASPDPIRIEHGERIAQIVLNRFEVAEWVEGEVAISTDRVGGLGSTGSR